MVMGVNLKNRNNEREYKVGSAAYLKPFDSDSYLTEVPHGDLVSCRLVSAKKVRNRSGEPPSWISKTVDL